MKQKLLKAAIIAGILSVAISFFLYTNYVINKQAEESARRQKQNEREDKAQEEVVVTEVHPFKKQDWHLEQYPDGPEKKFCLRFAEKAVPDILLKGPKAIDALNQKDGKLRCRSMFPALTPLTPDQLEDARGEVTASCMKDVNQEKIKKLQELLDTMPLDCKE